MSSLLFSAHRCGTWTWASASQVIKKQTNSSLQRIGFLRKKKDSLVSSPGGSITALVNKRENRIYNSMSCLRSKINTHHMSFSQGSGSFGATAPKPDSMIDALPRGSANGSSAASRHVHTAVDRSQSMPEYADLRAAPSRILTDSFGRFHDYLRISLTASRRRAPARREPTSPRPPPALPRPRRAETALPAPAARRSGATCGASTACPRRASPSRPSPTFSPPTRRAPPFPPRPPRPPPPRRTPPARAPRRI